MKYKEATKETADHGVKEALLCIYQELLYNMYL